MWWTFAAAIVASATALVIAFHAYPWQKNLDRKIALAAEERRVWEKFLGEAHRFYVEAYAASEAEQTVSLQGLRASLDPIYLYSSDEAAEAAKSILVTGLMWHSLLNEGRGSRTQEDWDQAIDFISSSFMKAERLAIAFIRAEIVECDLDEALETVTIYENGTYVPRPDEDTSGEGLKSQTDRNA